MVTTERNIGGRAFDKSLTPETQARHPHHGWGTTHVTAVRVLTGDGGLKPNLGTGEEIPIFCAGGFSREALIPGLQ